MSGRFELIRIIKTMINGEQIVSGISISDWDDIIEFARQQGLLVYIYLYANQLKEDERPNKAIMNRLRQSYALEVARDIRQLYAVNALRAAFGKNGIKNLFFKGAVTKTRYKNELLRSMGDIDFLYDPEQDSTLKKTMNDIGFSWDHRGRVHDLYRREKDVLIEAHRQLLPYSSPYYSFGDNIWNRVSNVVNYSHSSEMSIEDEIVFNIIHLASHFKKGGAGIRFIVDAWVYEQLNADKGIIEAKLKEQSLVKFYCNVLLLARRWFGDKLEDSQSAIITEMEDFILFGGIFGSQKNSVDAAVSKGKARYITRVVFPDFKEMQSMFPWLKHRFLLSYAWFYRILESLLCRRNNIRVLLNPIKSGNTRNTKLVAFYHKCGLV